MSHTRADRVLALAGLFQATLLVDRVAWGQQDYDDPALEASLQSILAVDASDVPTVYGGTAVLRCGLDALLSQFRDHRNPGRGPVPYYGAALLQLERRLQRNRELFNRLGEGIESARRQTEYFGLMHENTLAALADLYQQSAGQLGPRVMVRGEPALLQNPRNAGLVRALLLAGIRSAVLWRQCGGTRLGLLFGRAGIVAEAHRLRQRGLDS